MKVVLFGLSDSATAFLTQHFSLKNKSKSKENGLEVFHKHSYQTSDGNYYPLFIYRRKGFRTIEETLQKKMESEEVSFYFCALKYENDNHLIAKTIWNDPDIEKKVQEMAAPIPTDPVDQDPKEGTSE